VAEHYNAIVKDGVIRPATEGVPPGERPAVWFSIHPTWEPTATKALRDPKTGEVHRATWKEMQRHGPVRIEVGPGHGTASLGRLSPSERRVGRYRARA
jgi:hypothetical protein